MSTLILNSEDLKDKNKPATIDNVGISETMAQEVDVIVYQEGHNTIVLKSNV